MTPWEADVGDMHAALPILERLAKRPLKARPQLHGLAEYTNGDTGMRKPLP